MRGREPLTTLEDTGSALPALGSHYCLDAVNARVTRTLVEHSFLVQGIVFQEGRCSSFRPMSPCTPVGDDVID